MSKDTEFEYDAMVYIGRFQPFHNGHLHVLKQALDKAQYVVVLVGSANMPVSVDNPWSFEEREQMIRSVVDDEIQQYLIIKPLDDIKYNDDAWLGQVQSIPSTIIEKLNLIEENDDNDDSADHEPKVGLIGFKKDDSSYYLDKFPQWDFYEIEEQWGTVNATEIRKMYFQRGPVLPHDLCDEGVIALLKQHMLSDNFKYVVEEREALEKIIGKWDGSPYPPQFVAADAVCTQAGHILLVTRGEAPGKGLLALPGGHVEPHKGDSFENALHELMEEAQPMDAKSFKRNRPKPIPMGRLRGCYTGQEKRFDAPGRDPRGYYLTTAFRFVFPGNELWEVLGGDDAAKAAWYPIGSLDPQDFFADHYFIIQQMLDKTGGR